MNCFVSSIIFVLFDLYFDYLDDYNSQIDFERFSYEDAEISDIMYEEFPEPLKVRIKLKFFDSLINLN